MPYMDNFAATANVVLLLFQNCKKIIIMTTYSIFEIGLAVCVPPIKSIWTYMIFQTSDILP